MNISRLRSSAFSLVEVSIALGIAAFCLLAIFGLLPIGLTSNQMSVEQTSAGSMAASITADLRATPVLKDNDGNNLPAISERFKITIPPSGTATHTLFLTEDGKMVGALNANADPDLNPRFRAALVFTAPPDNSPQGRATSVRLIITWPAMADREGGKLPSTNPIKYLGSFETVIAFNRL